MIKRLFIIAGVLFLFAGKLSSQTYFFRNYSEEEGLPLSSLRCLLQDSRKYIWMGTDGAGLIRFDGNSFETYTTADGLADNIVYNLLEDDNGNIWIGTFNGLTVYNGSSFRTIGRDEGFTGSGVLKIFQDSDGDILAATNDKGLFRVNINDSITVTNYSTKDGLLNYFIFDIYEGEDKKIWLGMAGGLNIIEFTGDKSKSIKTIKNLDFPFPPDSAQIFSIEPDNEGTIWIGTVGKGLYLVRPGSGPGEDVVRPSALNRIMPGATFWDIMTAGSGELWLATDNDGIIRLKDEQIVRLYNTNNGLPTNQVLDIMEDAEGNYWFATLGQGAVMFNDEKFLKYGNGEGLPGSQIVSILSDPEGTLYTASEGGVARFINNNGNISKPDVFTRGKGLNDDGANVMIRKGDQIWIGTDRGINILKGDKLIQSAFNQELPSPKINCLFADSHENVWIGTDGGYALLSGNRLSIFTQDKGLIHNEIQAIIEDRKGRIWMGTIGGLVRIVGDSYTDFNEAEGLSFLRINCLAEDPAGNIWIGTFQGGIYRYSDKPDSLTISLLASKGMLSSNNITSILFVNDSTVIAGTDKGFDLLRLDNGQTISRVIHYGLNDGFSGENNPNSIALDDKGCVWFGTKNGLIRFEPQFDMSYNMPPQSVITDIKLFGQEVDWSARKFSVGKWAQLPENLVLSHKENHVTFSFTGLSFSHPDDLMFSYCLDRKQKNEWLPFSTNRSVPYSDLSPGNYLFKVRAKNKYGVIGDVTEYSFRIRPPFWQTKVFIISSGLISFLLVFMLVKSREKKLVKEKLKLEGIVKERTREVVEQKDEISRQRDILTNQQKEIKDSIHSAETIQKAVLPDENILGKYFTDYFVLFRPKDIVSGDFFWISEKNDKIIVTAADCTGHGVPGALMSMLGISYLRKIVNESMITQPDMILNSLRENIVLSLKQRDDYSTSKDGMDVAICSIDLKKMQMQFAGANNPLILVRKEAEGYSVTEMRADKMPVAFHSKMDPFTNYVIDIKNGDSIYMFSDGYNDQFGGPQGRKFLKHQFLKMLVENQILDMASQGVLYNKILDDWINFPSEENNSIGQIDDILVLGLRI